MALIQDWSEKYMKWQGENAYPTLDGYPLVSSPLPMIIILAVYLFAVIVGPRFMQNRQAWDLGTYNKIYNIAQLFFCAAYVIITYVKTEMPPNGYYLNCKILEKAGTKKGLEEGLIIYASLVIRFVELSETIVHILRKKTRQISVLHVSHHVFNVLMAWGLSRFRPGGTAATSSMLNFVVHFIMFSYYLAAASSNRLLSNFSKWFKKYLTAIQMAQFCYMIALMAQDLGFFHPSCKTNSFMTWFCLFCVTWDFVLFAHFYRVNYISKKKTT